MSDRRRLLRLGGLVTLVVGVLYTSATNTYNGDSYLSFPAAQSILHSRDLYLDEFDSPSVAGAYGAQDVDGHIVDYYPWAVALVAVPSVLVLDVAETVGVGPGSRGVIERNQMTYVQMANGIAATLAAVLVVLLFAYALTAGETTHRRRVAAWVAVGTALGTSAWSVTSRALWQHGPSMAMTGLAVLGAVQLDRGRLGRGWPLLMGAGLAAGYAVRPTNVLIVVALGTWVVLRHPRRAPWAAAGGALVAIPWVLVNRATWGTTLPPYHETGRTSVHDEFIEAMAANLISPARGLILYSPIVLLAVAGWWMVIRRRSGTALKPGLATALALASAAQVAAASSLDGNWWGGATRTAPGSWPTRCRGWPP